MSQTKQKMELVRAMGLSERGLVDVTVSMRSQGPIQILATYIVIDQDQVETMSKVLHSVKFEEQPS